MDANWLPRIQNDCRACYAFTLTELSIVLGIVGLILGSIWAATSAVYSGMQADDASRGILSTCEKLSNLERNYPSSQVSSWLVPSEVKKYQVFPDDWWQGDTFATTWSRSQQDTSLYQRP